MKIFLSLQKKNQPVSLPSLKFELNTPKSQISGIKSEFLFCSVLCRGVNLRYFTF